MILRPLRLPVLLVVAILLVPLCVATPASAQVQSVEYGDFVLSTLQDPITDKTTFALMTSDTDLDEATLGFTCHDGAFGLSVAFAPLLNVSNDTLPVIERFDKEEPAWQRWIGGPGVISLIEDDKKLKALLFAGMAMEASQVVLRLFDDSGDSHTYTFSLMGVTEGLVNMMPCWDPSKLLLGLWPGG